MRHPRLLLLTLTAATLVGVTAIALWASGSRSADAGAQNISFLIDCDTSTAGVQSNCVLPDGTSLTVDVVLVNHGPEFELSAFNLFLDAQPQTHVNPISPACSTPQARDCNPDALATTPGDWSCAPPPPVPDVEPDPVVASSFISCFSPVGGPVVSTGASIALARVTYSIPMGDVIAELAVHDSEAFDYLGITMGTCLDGTAFCGTGSVTVGAPEGTLTPTNTPTQTPTITPTSTPNPSPSPGVGAVSDVLGLHQTICVTAPVAKLGMHGQEAIFTCFALNHQPYFQRYADCLIDPACINGGPDPENPFHPTVDSFRSIDVDGDQIHPGQRFAIIAFVEADYPVYFETNRGRLTGTVGETLGPAALCYRPFDGIGDPDCDADPASLGDGVVVAYLLVDPTDARGPGQVTVTQNGVSKTLDFTIVGPPETITVTSIDNATEIETGAMRPTAYSYLPLDAACDGDYNAPLRASASPRKTHLFVQAFDSDGTAVVGTMMAVRHAGTGQAARFHPGVSTIGGLASAQLPTWDFGSQGAGMLAAICGATDPGVLDLEFAFDDGSSSGVNWDPFADFDFELPYSIPVVSTASVDDLDGFTGASLATHSAPANLNSLFDNCIFTANASQANGDGNFIDNGPNYAMDDATNPVSDSTGDACDGNDDNDGLLDADEIAGSDCAGIVTDPLDPDTDGDGTLDGAECLRGTSPTAPSSKPPATACFKPHFEGYTDLDGDGLRDDLERCQIGTTADWSDSDGDGVFDGCEVASLNEDAFVNSADQLLIAIEHLRTLNTGVPPLANFDLNRDGRVNSIDHLVMAIVMRDNDSCVVDAPD